MVGLAETGSGKTLAYLLPALVHVNAQPVLKEGEGPLALLLAPTRELAVQIHEEAVRFGHPCGVRSVRSGRVGHFGRIAPASQLAFLSTIIGTTLIDGAYQGWRKVTALGLAVLEVELPPVCLPIGSDIAPRTGRQSSTVGYPRLSK